MSHNLIACQSFFNDPDKFVFSPRFYDKFKYTAAVDCIQAGGKIGMTCHHYPDRSGRQLTNPGEKVYAFHSGQDIICISHDLIGQ